MIHIYTGEGKGKTTAAIGVAVRALGWNLKVCIFQFLKDKKSKTGELIALKRNKKHSRLVKIIKFDQRHPIFCSSEELRPELFQMLQTAIKKSIFKAMDILASRKYKIVVLDEIINTSSCGFIDEQLILNLMKNAPGDTELILTGRGATPKMIQLADYVTEMKLVKHPFRKKIFARKGVEY